MLIALLKAVPYCLLGLFVGAGAYEITGSPYGCIIGVVVYVYCLVAERNGGAWDMRQSMRLALAEAQKEKSNDPGDADTSGKQP
jgi:hypothetical protein